MQNNTDTRVWEDVDVLTLTASSCQLIVWNDEVNTFEWVIETLMEICGHSFEQAEQCAYIIHFKGKYAVKKKGSTTTLNLCAMLFLKEVLMQLLRR